MRNVQERKLDPLEQVIAKCNLGKQPGAQLLSDAEREHAASCGLSVREMIFARHRVDRDSYLRAVNGGTLTVRDCLAVLAESGSVDDEDLPSLPADIAADASLIASFRRAMEQVARAVTREGKPARSLVAELEKSAKELARARNEDLTRVSRLMLDLRAAILGVDTAAATRLALEAIAEHFGFGIDALPPPGRPY